MTTGQQRAWQRHWDRLGADIAELAPGTLDLAAWFGRSAPVALEIGSGMGEATAELARAEPALNHLAVEVYEAGLGQLLLRAENLGLENLRLLRGDATSLLRAHLAAESLRHVRILFPDPWPKKRHHKRRLIQPGFVGLLAARIEPGGTLHLATDWPDYAEQMRVVCTADPLLRNRFAEAPGGFAPRPAWRPETKFEARAKREGRVAYDLLFERA